MWRAHRGNRRSSRSGTSHAELQHCPFATCFHSDALREYDVVNGARILKGAFGGTRCDGWAGQRHASLRFLHVPSVCLRSQLQFLPRIIHQWVQRVSQMRALQCLGMLPSVFRQRVAVLPEITIRGRLCGRIRIHLSMQATIASVLYGT